MKVEYINPFILATKNLMSTMAGIRKFERKQLTADQVHEAAYDLSGVIGLTGGAAGTIVISFTNETAAAILSAVLGEKITEFDEMVRDSVGEIINIIAGSACSILSGNGLPNINRSIPNVIMGRGHKINTPSNLPNMKIYFATDLGDFAMQVSLMCE